MSPTNFTYEPEAQAAVQASAIAMALKAQTDLLSGDGSLMTSSLLPCFQHSSSTMEENEDITAYLFLDGSVYWKLNLTEPYWETITLHPNLPTPRPLPEGKGDFVDWVFVLTIMGGFLFGILKILQKSKLLPDVNRECLQSMVSCIFEFGRNNKNTYHQGNVMYDEDEQDNTSTKSPGTQRRRQKNAIVAGGASLKGFSQDIIPSSMGGTNSIPSMKNVNGVTVMIGNVHTFDYLDVDYDDGLDDSTDQDNEEEDDDDEADHELHDHSNHSAKMTRLKIDMENNNSGDSGDLLFEDNDISNGIEMTPQRSFSSSPSKRDAIEAYVRDPDLVALPNLVSTSRVAVPVGSRIQGQLRDGIATSPDWTEEDGAKKGGATLRQKGSLKQDHVSDASPFQIV